MSGSKVLCGKRYSLEFKLLVTRRYYSEKISIRSLSEEYGVNSERVRVWVKDYKTEVLRLYFKDDLSLTRMKKKDNASLEKEILRLREELKLASIKAEGYEYMLRLASEEYGEDLLKKVAVKQLPSSKEDTTK